MINSQCTNDIGRFIIVLKNIYLVRNICCNGK